MSDSAAKVWLLSHNKPLPALDIYHQKALEILTRKTASLSDLADIISLDPGISITLFNKMNAKRHASKRPYFNSVHSLLSLMGITAVTAFVKQFQPLHKSGFSLNTQQSYHQLISQNFHLMHQSAQLIKLQGLRNTNEIKAATGLQNIGEIYACLFDSQPYQKYQQACRLPNSIAADSAESLFGYNFSELGRLLSQELYLPDLAREAQQHSKSSSRTVRTMQIAAEITHQTETGWSHDAFTQSLNYGAEYLNYPVDNLRKKVLSAALDAASTFPISDVFPAIAKVILLPTIEKPKFIQESIPAIQKMSLKQSSPLFSDKVRSILKLPTTTQTTVIGLLINELTEKLQSSSVTFMLLSKDSSILSTRMSQGLVSESPLLQLKIKLSQDSLIKKLIIKPQSLWVKPDNFKQYALLLPDNFIASAQSQNFFLMSLFIGAEPIGVIYCDNTKTLGEAGYKTFKSNVSLTAKALTFLAQRAKKVSSRS